MIEKVPLYISNDLSALKQLVGEHSIKGLKRIDRLPGVAHRMFEELLQIQKDQERSYIIARRYLAVMDQLLKLTTDRRFLEICYGGEYRKVQRLISDLEADLEARYEDRARRRLNNQLQPQEYGNKQLQLRQHTIFDKTFIKSIDLFNTLRNKLNVLVVDVRRRQDFQESRIAMDAQRLINVPEDLVSPGLSANTLAARLELQTRAIWNRRDQFDAIVLMDWNTDHFNFQVSKLEHLRLSIVEWDLNRTYIQDPVVLDGGFKDFLERYPTEVTNCHVFLSRTNSEVDDLLSIDEVFYPEVSFINEDLIFNGSPTKKLAKEGKVLRSFHFQSNRSEEGSSIVAGDIKKMTGDINNRDARNRLNDSDDLENLTLPDELGALKPNMMESEDEYYDDVSLNSINYDRTRKPFQKVLGDGYTGITNLRNNCYMSCMLQCLKALPQFKSLFVTSNNYYTHIQKESPSIILNFASVMKKLWEGTPDDPKTFYPEKFFERVYDVNPIYRRGDHEDTFEFFIFLFNLLSEDCSLDISRLKVMTEREKSWNVQLQGRSSVFVDLFYYQMRNDKICWRCRNPNLVFDSDSTLMLALREDAETQRLEELLAEYLKANLVEDCSCSECKYSATIVDRKSVVLEPEILVIVLKRYAVSGDGTIRKIESEVSFPAEGLKFGRSTYRLFAVPRHSGTVSAGHYYASALLTRESKAAWVHFNDERVTECRRPITEVSGIRSSCVGFFYTRDTR